MRNLLFKQFASSKKVSDSSAEQIIRNVTNLMESKDWKESTKFLKMVDSPYASLSIECIDCTHHHNLLHVACRCQAPLSLVKKIANLCENQISELDCLYRLPFHVAVEYRAPYDVIEFLLKKKISAGSQVDAYQNTPLHIALIGYKEKKDTYSDLELKEYNDYLVKFVNLICQVAPSSLYERNIKDLTPYEIACSEGAISEILNMLYTR